MHPMIYPGRAVPSSNRVRQGEDRNRDPDADKREERESRFGTSIELAKLEVEQLYPLPYRCRSQSPCLIWGVRNLPKENSVKGGEADGVSVSPVSQGYGIGKRTGRTGNRFRAKSDNSNKTPPCKKSGSFNPDRVKKSNRTPNPASRIFPNHPDLNIQTFRPECLFTAKN